MAARETIERRILLAIALSGLTACGGGDLLLPKDGEPAHIVAFQGDNQSGTVGQPLTNPLVAKVTDPTGRPVPDVEVTFTPPTGGQLAPDVTVRTGSNGEAAVNFTLGPASGQQVIQAQAAAIVPSSASSATFTAMAQPGAAVALVVDAGNGQSGQTSAALAESLAVRAVDQFGNGVAGIEVTWEASGGGSVSPTSAVTGPDGRAATQRTLGDRAGAYRAAAMAEGLQGSPLSFSATAIGPALSLATEPPSTAAAGVALDPQPEIQLLDPLGGPLTRADVNVTVQIAGSDGSLAGRTSAKSDANGRARFADLEFRGPAGARTLIFAAEGFTSVASNPITVGAGPPAASASSASVPNGTAGVSTTIEIHLADQFGNPAAGAAGLVSVSVAGANPASSIPVAEVGGGTYSASYVPVHTGNDAIGIQVGGATVGSGAFNSVVAPGPTDPSHSTADIALLPNIFYYVLRVVVTVRDGQGNPVGIGGSQVQVAVDGAAPAAARDNGDGTYVAEFGTLSFNHTVAITLNGTPIQGSPYSTP